MGHWVSRLVQVMGHADTQSVEIFFSMLKLSWGIFLLVPVVSLGAGLRVFGFVVPEVIVGLWFALIGVMQFIGLFVLSLPLRILATFCAMPTWMLLTGSILVASPKSTLWVLMAVLSATNVWLYLRLRRRAP